MSVLNTVRKNPVPALLLCAFALAALTVLDQHYTSAGWWIFVVISLTVGFAHGALDVVLLARESTRPLVFALAVLVYLLATLAIAAVLVVSGWLVLPVLLGLTAWHFGEPYGRWASGDWRARLVVGGAAAMLPALVSPVALQALLHPLFGAQATDAWLFWQLAAFAWLAASIAALLAWRKQPRWSAMATEICAVLVLNVLLSPLLAFALYFGPYHAVDHIWRVATSQAAVASTEALASPESGSILRKSMLLLTRPGVLLTGIATALLLALLLVVLRQTVSTQGLDESLVLRWILIALTAVTAPHLVLVRRCAGWLSGDRDISKR